jgi:hypothetical protein
MRLTHLQKAEKEPLKLYKVVNKRETQRNKSLGLASLACVVAHKECVCVSSGRVRVHPWRGLSIRIQHDYEVIRPIVPSPKRRQSAVGKPGWSGPWWAIKPDALSSKVWRASDRRPEQRGPHAPGYPDAIARYILYINSSIPPSICAK